ETSESVGIKSHTHFDPATYKGKHWTVAHTAPEHDQKRGVHTHTHHFKSAHSAMKYAQHWEDNVGQHNNDRPEIYGPDHDEKLFKAEIQEIGEFMAKNATKQWEHKRLKGV